MSPLFPLQQVDPVQVQQTLGVGGRAVGAFLGTLVVGALVLAFAEEYLEAMVRVVREEPVPSFVWGLGVLVGFFVFGFLLLVSIVGILLLPLLLVVGVVLNFVGSAVVYVFVGGRIAESADWETSRWGHLLVGAVVSGVLAAIPVVGALANFVVSGIGVGAIIHSWYRNRQAAA